MDRIALWLGAGFLLFAGIVASLWRAEAGRMNQLYDSLRDEKSQTERRALELEARRMHETADAYAIWTDLGDWIASPSRNAAWGETTMNDRWLADNSDARFVYDRAGRPVGTWYSSGREFAKEFRPDSEWLADVLEKPRVETRFVRNGGKVAEVVVASVQQSDDTMRRREEDGILVLVRVLDQRWIAPLGGLLGGEVTLASERDGIPTAEDRARAVLVTLHPLVGEGGVPVAYLRAEQERPSLAAAVAGGRRSLIINGAFALLAVLAFGAALSRWIARPMAQLIRALEEDRPEALGPLLEKRSDFGQLARAVDRSFRDRTRLREELELRKRTERELREATVRAEEANRTKSAFLAQMSHEIRTPMNGVLGMTDLLLAEPLEPEERDYASAIRSSAGSLLRLLNDLLDLSKIEAGKLALGREEFYTRSVFEDATRLFAPAARAKGVRIVCDVFPDTPPKVWGDPQRLRQIVMNLLGNAVKFTENGEIVVRATVRLSDGWTAGSAMELTIDVADTGIGIPADRLDAVFETFSQADETTSVRYGGTGLGLPIARSLARSMGGDLVVRSVAGRGSAFRATAKLEVSDFPGADPTSGTPYRATIRHESPSASLALARLLRSFGWTVAEVGPVGEVADDAQWVFFSHGSKRRVPERSDLKRVLLRQLGAGESGLDDADAELSEPLRWYEVALLAGVVVPTDPLNDPKPISDRLEGLQVLVAEDNPVNQIVAQKTMEKFGCVVTVVPDGRSTVERVRAGGIDIVLMDLQMPIMDGIEATRMIRAGERGSNRHVPIVAVTANASPEDRDRCLDAGMDEFLPKPFRSEDLLAALDRLAEGGARPVPSRTE